MGFPTLSGNLIEVGRSLKEPINKGVASQSNSCSRAGGDNRKRARSAQRRVGPKARPTAGAPAPGSPVRASFP